MSIDRLLRPEEFVGYLTDDDYDALIETILHRIDPMPMSNLLSCLHSTEQRIANRQVSELHSANAARYGNHAPHTTAPEDPCSASALPPPTHPSY
jgi:hypothetical protein